LDQPVDFALLRFLAILYLSMLSYALVGQCRRIALSISASTTCLYPSGRYEFRRI
jgi:hypothetical protein